MYFSNFLKKMLCKCPFIIALKTYFEQRIKNMHIRTVHVGLSAFLGSVGVLAEQ